MIFTSGLGVLLSLIFGCLLLGLVAELYYLLWWKKHSLSLSSRSSSSSRRTEEVVIEYIKHAKENFYLSCFTTATTKPNQTSTSTRANPADSNNDSTTDLESGDFFLKSFGGIEEDVEAELMRLHNLSGPPRFLFTIKEETKEDLESEDGAKSARCSRSRKASRTRSLGDLVLSVESPFLSPLASPKVKSGASNLMECYSHHGFNPLFESSNVLVDAELNRLRSSPPPKFKFLRDAEEKLYRRLLEEAEKMHSAKKVDNNGCSDDDTEEVDQCKDGSIVKILVEQQRRERERGLQQQQQQVHSASVQVLPLDSSPPSTQLLHQSSSEPLGTKH